MNDPDDKIVALRVHNPVGRAWAGLSVSIARVLRFASIVDAERLRLGAAGNLMSATWAAMGRWTLWRSRWPHGSPMMVSEGERTSPRVIASWAWVTS
jgi:hypothetical protein